MATTEPTVTVERRGALVVVTLSRPTRRNGATIQMCHELYDALRVLPDTDARVVILRGAGDDFSVGADLGGGSGSEPANLESLGPVYHAATLLHTMPQVTIAAVDGGCAGAAMGWACACDLRFASDRARFNTAFLQVGVSGDMGLVWSLARLVGGAKARELLLFPGKIDAREALEVNLVNRVIPSEQLHDEVLETADALAARRPLALRLIKANILSAERMDMAEYVEVESARHLHSTSSNTWERT